MAQRQKPLKAPKARRASVRCFTLPLPPYPCLVTLYQATDRFVVDTVADADGCQGLCHCQGATIRILVKHEGYTLAERESTLIHEALHATFHCLQYVGIDPTSNDGEVSTYLLTYIFDNLRKHLLP